LKTLIFFLLLLICGCSAPKKLSEENSTGTNKELIHAQQKVPGITMDQLALGRKLYIRNCSGCHSLKKPSSYTVDRWHPILMKMFVKAKITDEATKKLIGDYVTANSK